MLKLLKHDIKDSYLEILILNGILIALSLLVLLSIKTQITFLLIITIFAWFITLLAAYVVVLKSIIRNFHSKLFTDYGYLTLTTPVSIDKILISKIIISMLWLIVTIIGIVISVLILLSSMLSVSMLASFAEFLMQNPLKVFKFIIQALVSALSFIAMLIFVLVLVNMGRMKKHKMLKAILIFIALEIIVSSVIQLINKIENSTVSYIIGLIVNLAWSVLIYFASRYLITHKLELE